MRYALIWIAVALCLGGIDRESIAQTPKAAVPTASAQKLARVRMQHRIGGVAKAETPAQQIVLARRLIKLGSATRDQDLKYVLLIDAIRVATKVRDAEMIDEAVREIVKSFDVDGAQLWQVSLARLQGKGSPNLANVLMRLANESLALKRVDDALVFGRNASIAAKGFGSEAQVKAITDQRRALHAKVSAMSKPIPSDRVISGRSGDRKKELLQKYGATDESQTAVANGILWLQRNQHRDGSWGMDGPYSDGRHYDDRCAATAMSMLVFLASGHTDRHGDYLGEMVLAKKFLVAMQAEDGLFAGKSTSHERMYAQALATIAICELYSMTGDDELREPARRAIEYAESAQSDLGGWRYSPRQDADTSVTSWVCQALFAGRDAGLRVDQDKLDAINSYLDTVSSYDGAAYGYQPRRPPSPAMTAAGLLCRQYLGQKPDSPVQVKGLEAIVESGNPFDQNVDSYYRYHAMLLFRQAGGDPWKQMNERMLKGLTASQTKQGDEIGSWNPQEDAWQHGRLYTTCLSLLCLETYYRHLSAQDRADQLP